MQRLGILILLVLSVCSRSHAVDLSADDKNMHLGVSYNVTAAATHTLSKLGVSRTSSALISGGMVMLAGLVKERVVDVRGDNQDIEANFYGATLGMVIPFQIEF